MFSSESKRKYTIEVDIKKVEHLQFVTFTMSHEDGTVFYQQYKQLDTKNAGMYINMYCPANNVIANLPTHPSLQAHPSHRSQQGPAKPFLKAVQVIEDAVQQGSRDASEDVLQLVRNEVRKLFLELENNPS